MLLGGMRTGDHRDHRGWLRVRQVWLGGLDRSRWWVLENAPTTTVGSPRSARMRRRKGRCTGERRRLRNGLGGGGRCGISAYIGIRTGLSLLKGPGHSVGPLSRVWRQLPTNASVWWVMSAMVWCGPSVPGPWPCDPHYLRQPATAPPRIHRTGRSRPATSGLTTSFRRVARHHPISIRDGTGVCAGLVVA